MQENQVSQPTSQKNSILYLKFLISLPTLHLAYKILFNIADTSSTRGVALILWGIIFFIWGVWWFIKLPNFNKVAFVEKINRSAGIKKGVKWLQILLVVIAVVFTVFGLFDDFIPGYSGKDFFIILLAPIIH